MSTSSSRLVRARTLAPAAYRRWVLGGISLALIGYGSFAFLDVLNGGGAALTSSRHVVMVMVCLITLAIAAFHSEQLGCVLTIIATWVEVQTAFLNAAAFPAGGMLVVPVLVLSVGLLLGARVAFVSMIVSLIATVVLLGRSPAAQAALPADGVYWMVMYVVAMASTWALLTLGLSGFTRVFDAMTASQKDLADTIQFTPDGILVVDAQGTVLLANPAAERLLAGTGRSIVGSQFAHIITVLVGEAETLEALMRARGNEAAEVMLQLKGDPVVHIEANWRSMDAGRHQLLLRDVTRRVTAEEQRHAMESQLAHAQRLDAVGRLAGGLSHDFNNILTAVSGSAELLRRTRDEGVRTELIDEIIAARDRGTSLTRQLLSFSRRDVRQARVFDVAEAISNLERLLTRVGGERQELVLDLAKDCRISADPGQFEQAVVNLVANARDAMPNGGTCTITVRGESSADGMPRVLLQVRDTGSGMPAAIAARAFEPFFTTKGRGQGTGLGLASVHAMATQGNGTARIDTAPGRGTCITLDLPAALDSVSVPPVLRPSASTIEPGTHRILVAEDDSGTRRVVERILQHAGYSVQTCADGREAMAVVDATSVTIDLVLSDIMMPGHTGPEVAERVALVRPGTPVLLMSGYAEDYLSGVLSERLQHEVITKPFSGAALTARIAELIRRAPAAGSVTAGAGRG